MTLESGPRPHRGLNASFLFRNALRQDLQVLTLGERRPKKTTAWLCLPVPWSKKTNLGNGVVDIPITSEQTTGLKRNVPLGAPEICLGGGLLHDIPRARGINHCMPLRKGNCLPSALERGKEAMNP